MKLAGLLALALAFAGCEDDAAPKPEPTARVVSFVATPETVEIGQSTVLTWKVENAGWMRLEEVGGGEIGIDNRATTGSVEVKPKGTASYLLTAKGSGGEATATVSVGVSPLPAAPQIASFQAEPAEIAPGGSTRLSWSTSDADTVVVKDQLGNQLDLGAAEAASGSVEFLPDGDMVYTLIATNRGGSSRAETAVDVVGAPNVSFNGPSAAIEPGAMGRLTWSVTGASSLAIVDDRGQTVHQSDTELSGSLDVTADYTRKFVLTATGTGGETSRMAEVAVAPVIDSFEITTPGPVRPGDEVELAWTTRGATHVSVLQTGATLAELEVPEATNGTLRATVGPEGAFQLRARSGSLIATRSATIALDRAPTIDSFTVDRTEVSARADLPATVTMSWHVDGAEHLVLAQSTGGVVSLAGESIRADSVEVELIADTTYTLTASNEFGEQTATVSVDVFPAARIVSFDARPLRVGAGDDLHLSWETEDAVEIRIERDGVDVTGDPLIVDGSRADAIFGDGVYVFTAIDVIGNEQISDPIAITVGAPIISSFTVDRASVAAGTALRFAWQNIGGTSLEILDENGAGTGCSTTSLHEIPADSCTITAPLTDDTITYTLRVGNDAGQVTTATVDVVVVGGPVIQSFTASRSIASSTDVVTFTWSVDDDAMGNQPRLVLTDDIGNSYAELQAPGLDTNSGSVDVTLPASAAGATRFTLRAETDDTTPSQRTVDLAVFGLPAITSLAATPDDLDTQGGTVPVNSTIDWTTAWGVSATLYRLDPSGSWILPPVHASTDPAEIASGSVVVAPTAGIYNYELVVANAAGRQAEAGVSIYVDVAKTTLSASHNEILKGEAVSLTWSTTYATSVTITPASPISVDEIRTPFEDVSSTGTQLTLGTNLSSGGGRVSFPAGFTFPFFGTNQTGAHVSTDGWIGFDSLNSSPNSLNVAMPASGSAWIHLAPFWDDLFRNANSKIYWQQKSDAAGDYVVIQWKSLDLSTLADRPANLNFEVVLRSNGDIEYRYGSMDGVNKNRSNGSTATIGLQNPTGTVGATRLLDTAMPGGLSDRSFTFRYAQPLPLSETWNVAPRADTTYTVDGINSFSNDARSVAIRVFPEATVGTPTLSTSEPLVGVPFALNWTSTNATAVTVEDDLGVPRCTYSNVNSGSCSLTETIAGNRTYTVRVVGKISRDVKTAVLATPIYSGALELTSLTASPAVIEVGQSSTIGWQTIGATAMTLTANGVPVDLTGKSMSSDSLGVSPTRTTTYELRITESGRSRTARAVVEVRLGQVTSSSATATQIANGGSTTVSWSANGDYVWFSGSPTVAAVELTGGAAPFIDTSTSSTARQLTGFPATNASAGVKLDFPSGFRFPYSGVMHSSMKVFTAGYASFEPSAVGTSFNQGLPYEGSDNFSPHLMPFWDALLPGNGQVWYDLRSDTNGRYLVIQWKNWQFSNASFNPADLNFEVVLRENGVFEYRYGTMSSVTSSGNYGDGLGATIGYQEVGGQASALSYNAVVPGGLANRTWRYDPRVSATGSQSVAPTASGSYEICAGSEGYVECRSVPVVVVKTGDIIVTEVMASPALPRSDPDGEWFEIRNASPYAIDVNGWTIDSGPMETHTIANGGPLVVAPGSFLVLTRGGSSATGIAGSYVYGATLSLDHSAGDQVKLGYGTLEVDRFAWAGAWTAASGQSLALEPSLQKRSATPNDTIGNWCVSTAPYDGANAGSPGASGASCKNSAYDLDISSARPFIDIAASASAVDVTAANADGGYAQLSGGIGFSMPWFSSTVTGLSISANGFVSFDALTDSWPGNEALPSPWAPTNLVAAYWDWLEPQPGSSVKTERRTVGSHDVRIVQWTGFKLKGTDRPGVVTLQIQLWSNGDIVTAVKDLSTPNRYSPGMARTYSGGSATLGIQQTSSIGLMYSYETGDMVWPGQSLHYRKK